MRGGRHVRRLRGIAFIGDAVAHASFPGVVAAYLLAIPFYVGAAVAAVATALAIGYVTRRARIRADTAIGVLFAGTFALGVFLYSTIDGYVADLFSFLFGYLLSIDLSDLIALTALGGLVLLIVGVFWKELLYATFDPGGAAASGLRVDGLEYLFLALVALTIVISLQAVGIILVVAMLVTPAAAAQLLTVRFGSLMALAIVLGVASSVAGLYLSFWLDVASGATIVLVQTALFLAALASDAAAGLLSRRWRRRARDPLNGAASGAGPRRSRPPQPPRESRQLRDAAACPRGRRLRARSRPIAARPPAGRIGPPHLSPVVPPRDGAGQRLATGINSDRVNEDSPDVASRGSPTRRGRRGPAPSQPSGKQGSS